jgi:hypothetical protein
MGNPLLRSDDLHMWMACTHCGARGPHVNRMRPDATTQALAGWNAGRKFGHVAVANVPGGMPPITCAIAERVRLVAEGLYKGEFGAADGAVLIFRAAGHATVSAHNLSKSDVLRVLDAVRADIHVRAASIPLPGVNR